MRILILVPAVLALLSLSSSSQVEASSGVTTRVSIASDGTQANDWSFGRGISADGRFVAFQSYASNLVAADNNGVGDAFVHDRQTGTTARVSVDSAGGEGIGWSGSAVISGDGRFVAFQSGAFNLVTGDANNNTDVFVHDGQTGATTRASVDSASGEANQGSYGPAISDDGRFVAFVSEASNLVDGDGNNYCYNNLDDIPDNCADIFVRDTEAGTTTRVSVPAAGGEADNLSSDPVISGDGRYVSFWSWATNLIPGDVHVCYNSYNCAEVFLRDLQAGTIDRVSVDSNEAQANGDSYSPSVSLDSRYVAFYSLASNLVPGDSNNFCDNDGDDVYNENCSDIFVRDRQLGTTTRVSVASGGAQANGESYRPSISGNGRFVSFESYASNLVDGDTNNSCDTNADGIKGESCADVFVHDRQTGTTTRVSVVSGGGQANAESSWGAVSGEGRFVIFLSFASNLVAGDTNTCVGFGLDSPASCPDVFVHDLGDSDSDGEWDPFDPCPTSAEHTDSDGDLKPDACDGGGSGNVDCSPPPTGVSAVDALKVLRFSAGLSVAQSEPCLDIGLERLPPGVGIMGDVNCSGGGTPVNAVDALLVLRAVAGLPPPANLPVGCAPIIIVLPP